MAGRFFPTTSPSAERFCEIHPHCVACQDFTHLHSWVVVHCMNVPPFIYPCNACNVCCCYKRSFISAWAYGGCCCCDIFICVFWCIRVSFPVGYIPGSETSGREGMCVYPARQFSEVIVPVHAHYCACVHAKSLQSCTTLCNPMDCSPPGSSVCGILQAKILEWVAMNAYSKVFMLVLMLVLSFFILSSFWVGI